MSSDPMMPPTRVSIGEVSKQAGQAAIHAVMPAVVAAVANAAKPGVKTSELKVVVGGIVLSGLIAGLQVFSVIPGPWTVPALLISTALTAAGYAISRGNVKSAALRTAADTLQISTSNITP